ncbi:MAG: hypothetical protein MAG453_01432 [Calditrichaeota bacterium]|nr:hypothetical protein [Calditrichota bacterium]
MIAVGGIGLVSLVRGDRRAGVGWLLASAASLLPLAVLVVIWGGIGPPSGLERWTLGEPLRWRPGTFTTLVAMLAVYLLPVLAVRAGTLWREAKRSWWVVPAAAAFYIVFPVRASRVAVEQAGIETVGFVHRGLHAVLPGPGVDAALLLMFALGALVVAVFVRGLAAWPRAGFAGERGALAVIVLLFLLLLPLSYQNWEKYLLPVLPLAAALVIARFGAGESARVDTPAGNNRRNEQ